LRYIPVLVQNGGTVVVNSAYCGCDGVAWNSKYPSALDADATDPADGSLLPYLVNEPANAAPPSETAAGK
jgi:hypothetical protein